HHLPRGVQPSRRERALLRGPRRRDAAGRKHRRTGLGGNGLDAGPREEREPDDRGDVVTLLSKLISCRSSTIEGSSSASLAEARSSNTTWSAYARSARAKEWPKSARSGFASWTSRDGSRALRGGRPRRGSVAVSRNARAFPTRLTDPDERGTTITIWLPT